MTQVHKDIHAANPLVLLRFTRVARNVKGALPALNNHAWIAWQHRPYGLQKVAFVLWRLFANSDHERAATRNAVAAVDKGKSAGGERTLPRESA
ncbi:hypothetical protein [Pseudomonas sp. DG56-2]|uniref:hypothetical protein n=1 Tax=Pseudomonas sp. DG56-2 TaxID=2320270 RepID=UPI001C49A112|nr:hypothetical protein [Pseudomonas sp. DG56-2]